VPDRHYVYLYRAPSSGAAPGKPKYVGYGMSVQRALSHPENSHNPRLLKWLADGHYTLEVAGPYASEGEGRRVESALISALVPEFNVAKGSPRFRPVGVPGELAERSGLPRLSLAEVARRVGGALFVYLSDADLTDGRTTYNPADPDDEVVRSNIEAWWDLSAKGVVDQWRRNPDDAPAVLVGTFGPDPRNRFIVGAALIDCAAWGSADQRDDRRWRVPLVEPTTLDAFELRGRRLVHAGFGQFSSRLHIWVDSLGRTRHPLGPAPRRCHT
jgi:hypothetical protein